MANFFVKKNESFFVTLPFDCRNPQDPKIIFTDGLADLPKNLQAVPEEALEYHFMKWRKPDWGMDCFLKELAYTGTGVRDRVFSSAKLDEVRLRYLLVDSSFFAKDTPIQFVQSGSYETLSGPTEEIVKQISPFILRVFLTLAERIWDIGLSPNDLCSEEDYKTLRNDPHGLRKVLESKAPQKVRSVIPTGNPEEEKKT
jgi:hypothetical protein